MLIHFFLRNLSHGRSNRQETGFFCREDAAGLLFEYKGAEPVVIMKGPFCFLP
jgi:hypothetical protein